MAHKMLWKKAFLHPEHSFSSLNDTIRHALVTKPVNSEAIPITSNFILKLHKMHISHLPDFYQLYYYLEIPPPKKVKPD